jgi:hypothetical protein
MYESIENLLAFQYQALLILRYVFFESPINLFFMAQEQSDIDRKVMRKILKRDIAAHKLLLSLPGLTDDERLRYWTFITDANLMRHRLRGGTPLIP